MRIGTLPQIVGLTASLGAGKSETVADAKTHIISLCANLDTPVIVTVQKHAEELKKRSVLMVSNLIIFFRSSCPASGAFPYVFHGVKGPQLFFFFFFFFNFLKNFKT